MVNFRLKHLNKSKKINIIITPLKPKFYSKTFSFNLFNIDKAERVHMNIILCQGSSWSYFFVNFLILVFFDILGPFLRLTERRGQGVQGGQCGFLGSLASLASLWLPWFKYGWRGMASDPCKSDILTWLKIVDAMLSHMNSFKPLQKRW